MKAEYPIRLWEFPPFPRPSIRDHIRMLRELSVPSGMSGMYLADPVYSGMANLLFREEPENDEEDEDQEKDDEEEDDEDEENEGEGYSE